MNDATRTEIRDLADRHSLSLLTEQDASRLNELLQDDADAQRIFLEVTGIYARLQWEFSSEVSGGTPPTPSVPASPSTHPNIPRPHWKRTAMRIAASAVVALLIGWTVSTFLPEKNLVVDFPPEPMATVATLINSVDARWQAGRAPGQAALAAGRVVLEQGLAEIEFTCGAVAVLKAPADFELINIAEAFLHSGQVVVRIPKESRAESFRIETPTSQLLDLGTEFGVEVDDSGDCLMQVYEGEVLAKAKAANSSVAPERVLEGEAVRVDQQLHKTEFWPERFVRLLPGPDDPNGPGNYPSNVSRYDSIDILPATGDVIIDGDFSDWDLSARLHASCDPPLAEFYYVDASMMFDENYLYIGAHVGDPYPMRSKILPTDPVGLHGAGGSVALRLSTDRQAGWPLTAEGGGERHGRPASPADLSDQLSFVVMWFCEPEQRACIHLRHGMDFHGVQINPAGYRGAFRKDADGRGYQLEYAIPWEALHAADDPPRAGDELAAMWLVHWSDAAGRNWQGQLIDVMKPNEPGWNFQRAATWGKAIYHPVRPSPAR